MRDSARALVSQTPARLPPSSPSFRMCVSPTSGCWPVMIPFTTSKSTTGRGVLLTMYTTLCASTATSARRGSSGPPSRPGPSSGEPGLPVGPVQLVNLGAVVHHARGAAHRNPLAGLVAVVAHVHVRVVHQLVHLVRLAVGHEPQVCARRARLRCHGPRDQVPVLPPGGEHRDLDPLHQPVHLVELLFRRCRGGVVRGPRAAVAHRHSPAKGLCSVRPGTLSRVRAGMKCREPTCRGGAGAASFRLHPPGARRGAV